MKRDPKTTLSKSGGRDAIFFNSIAEMGGNHEITVCVALPPYKTHVNIEEIKMYPIMIATHVHGKSGSIIKILNIVAYEFIILIIGIEYRNRKSIVKFIKNTER